MTLPAIRHHKTTRKMILASTREDHMIAQLAALAIVIHVLESALPSPLPGVKPGLANIITVITLCLYGWRMAAWVSLLRVVIGSLIVGSFLSPGFVLALSGALCALFALRLSQFWPGLGALGMSALAAQAHMLGQFMVAYWLFLPHEAIFKLLPILLTAALVFGCLSGYLAERVIAQISQRSSR